MKKAYVTLIIALISIISTFAQINIKDKGRLTNPIIAADSYCCVIKNDNNNYELRISLQNATEPSVINITLGTDEQSAIKSLTQIDDWMAGATLSEYLILEQNGESITIFKSHSNRVMISKGDQFYCKQLATSIATGMDTKDALPYGYCTTIIIKKALKQLNTAK